MNSSSRSDNVSSDDLALPLAAVISLTITSYVVVVLVGIVFQKWLVRFFCAASEPTTGCNCDICPVCFSSSCCSNSGINCCSMFNCCNAGTFSCCRSIFTCCCETSQPIDCQSCDCCCFEIAFHLKGRRPAGSGTVP